MNLQLPRFEPAATRGVPHASIARDSAAEPATWYFDLSSP
jgi:hypothetical protein